MNTTKKHMTLWINSIIICLFVLTETSCYPLNVSFNSNYDIKNKQGLKTGLWLEPIDSNSVIISRYKLGKRQGKAKIVYTNGSYSTLYYKNNVKNGIQKYYTQNGVLCLLIMYENNQIKYEKHYCGPTW